MSIVRASSREDFLRKTRLRSAQNNLNSSHSCFVSNVSTSATTFDAKFHLRKFPLKTEKENSRLTPEKLRSSLIRRIHWNIFANLWNNISIDEFSFSRKFSMKLAENCLNLRNLLILFPKLIECKYVDGGRLCHLKRWNHNGLPEENKSVWENGKLLRVIENLLKENFLLVKEIVALDCGELSFAVFLLPSNWVELKSIANVCLFILQWFSTGRKEKKSTPSAER